MPKAPKLLFFLCRYAYEDLPTSDIIESRVFETSVFLSRGHGTFTKKYGTLTRIYYGATDFKVENF